MGNIRFMVWNVEWMKTRSRGRRSGLRPSSPTTRCLPTTGARPSGSAGTTSLARTEIEVGDEFSGVARATLRP